jgi:iron(III) transport system ATP-binding protein
LLTAVLGSSGSGKTTVLRAIAGFEPASAGPIDIAGRLVDAAGIRVPPERRHLGYVAQEGALFPHLTVAGNVDFGLRQQRVALVRALAVDPAVILLDEPFASLDAALRATVRSDIADILRRSGSTVLLVTHDQEEAMSPADQVAVLRDGRIAQVGTRQQLYSEPVDAAMAQFVGEANLLPAQIDGSEAHTILGTMDIDAARYGAGIALVRPEQITIHRSPAPRGTPGTVVGQQFHGHDSIVTVQPSRPGSDPVRARVLGSGTYSPGTLVHLQASGKTVTWPAT